MSWVVDVAFYVGVGILGYSAGGVLGAGIALVAAAVLAALLSTTNHDSTD